MSGRREVEAAYVRLEPFKIRTHEQLLGALTDLLHSAYRPLAERGMRYVASYQKLEVTLERLQKGEAFLAFVSHEVVGTISLYRERPDSRSLHYRKQGVFHFGQFAVRPDWQGRGVGARMLEFVEQRAQELGASELALDTSEQAVELIRTYERRGYRFVEHVQWEVTNYRSVILSKGL